jgi:hypothetical protein
MRRTRPTVIGPSCAALIAHSLSDQVLERLRAAQGVLALFKPYGAARLEAACARAMAHGSPFYRTSSHLDHRRRPARRRAPTPPGYGRTRFTRPATEPFADLIAHPQQELLH